MTKEKLKKYIYYFAAGLILLFGFSLRLKGYITNPPLWHDESALGWNILNKSYGQLFEKLRFLQIAPPLFLICTKILVFITDGYHNIFRCDLTLRFIPFLCGNLSLVMYWFIGDKIFNSKWTTLAGVALLAFNPVLINYSFEFKPYSVDVLFSLIALYVFLCVDFKKSSAKKMLLYSLILAILPWFSFGSTFVIIAGFLTLSFKKENPPLFITLLIPVLVSAFAYLKLFVINSFTSNSAGMIGFWKTEFVNKDFSNLPHLINQNIEYFFMNIKHMPLIFIMLFIIIGFILFIKDKKYFYIAISVLTATTEILASTMQFYPFSRRMILFLLPFLITYIVKITDIKKWYIGWIIFMVVLIPHIIFTNDYQKIKYINKGDYSRTMVEIIAKSTTPDETITLSEGSNADYFYYNTFYNLPNKVEYIKPDTSKNETIEQLLNRLPAGKYWIFMSYDYNTEFKTISRFVNWAEKHGKIEFKTQATQSCLIRLTLD